MRWIVVALLCGLLAVAAYTTARSQVEGRVLVFEPVLAAQALPPPRHRSITREAHVSPSSLSLMETLIAGQAMTVQFFDRRIALTPDERRESTEGILTFRARDAASEHDGAAVLARYRDQLALDVRLGARAYRLLRQPGGQVFRLTEIDTTALPEEGPTMRGPGRRAPPAPLARREAGAEVTVLLLATSDLLKAQAEKNVSLELLRRQVQGSLDEVYLNGRNGFRVPVRIVEAREYPGQVTYSSETQLDWLTVNSAVQQARQAVRADLVFLLGVQFDNCGLAWWLDGGRHPEWGFGLAGYEVDCNAKYTIAHEIGHNLGADHARGDANTPIIAGRCHYDVRRPEIGKRTLMAYACAEGRCPIRVPYFSSPELFEGAARMGVSCGGADAAHNAETVRGNLPVVAAYF